jgi:PEP-CTERM motif
MKASTQIQRFSFVTKVAFSACAGIMVAFAPNASADLIAYEPFDYTAGTQLNGDSGGMGWSGAWRDATVAGATIQASGLTYAGLPTSGNSVLLSGSLGTLNIFRDFPNITGAAGTSIYISFIGQRVGPAEDPQTIPLNPYPRGVNVGFFNTENAVRQERATIGNSSGATSNAWSYIPTGSGSVISQSTTPYSDQAWVVLRIDFVGDDTVNDDAYLFINPDPSVEPSLASADVTVLGTSLTAGTFDYSGLDYVRPFVGGANANPYGELMLDELRIGTTYADMTSTTVVPEPATLGLFALGGLAFLLRRRNQ